MNRALINRVTYNEHGGDVGPEPFYYRVREDDFRDGIDRIDPAEVDRVLDIMERDPLLCGEFGVWMAGDDTLSYTAYEMGA